MSVSESAVVVADRTEVGLLGLHGAALTIGSNAAPMVQRETKRILKINDSNGRSVYGKRVYERQRWREEKKKTLIGIKEQTTL